MLTKRTRDIDRTRHEIEQRYQEKIRHVHEKVPDSKVGARGERQLYKPRTNDVYSIVNTGDDWRTLAFLKYETSTPSNDDGENGELRVLADSGNFYIIAKTSSGWKKTAALT